MKYLLVVFTLAMASLAWAQNPKTLVKGQSVECLKLPSGEVYEKFKVIDVTQKGVLIMTSSSTKWIKPEELPDEYKSLFVREDAEEVIDVIEETEREIKVKWQPQTVDDVVDCCLKVIVTKGVNEYGEKIAWNGSAFLVNERGGTYIYSNVHNFFGTKEFYFEFKDGRRIYSRDCGRVEVSDGKYGLNSKINKSRVGWGGDVIRIRLKKSYTKALTIDRTILDESFVNKPIVVTGNTGGRGEITQLEGLITHISDFDIINHNAPTESGNSGSPIVDLETLKVIGILTWGSYDTSKPMSVIWAKKPQELRSGINSGASLSRTKFKRHSFEGLYKERLYLNQMKHDVRVLGMLDTVYPTKTGLYFDLNKTIMGDYKVLDVVNASPNHHVVKKLLALDRYLEKKGESNIGMSNQDMLKVYLSTYRSCLGYMAKQRRSMESSLFTKSYFLQCNIKNTYIIDINKAYESTLKKNIGWYSSQRGTRGQALPVAKRIRLPHLDTGIEGFGIQKE